MFGRTRNEQKLRIVELEVFHLHLAVMWWGKTKGQTQRGIQLSMVSDHVMIRTNKTANNNYKQPVVGGITCHRLSTRMLLRHAVYDRFVAGRTSSRSRSLDLVVECQLDAT